MAGQSAGMSIETVKSQIRSIEEPRAEGHLGSVTGSKILNTPSATYKKGSK
jgi:hypothetical protein